MPAVSVTQSRDRLDPYSDLSTRIVRGELAPGARVSEDSLAELLGVSRTPVREAMRRLQREGLLAADGGGARPRVVVAPLSAGEARELYAYVGAIEGEMARAIAAAPAAERRRLADELRQRDERFRDAAARRRRSPDRLFALHDAFHTAIREASGGQVAMELLALLRPRLERYQWFQGPLVQLAGLTFSPTHAEHAAIVRAARSGSADDIERAVRTNWRNAGARFAEALTGARTAESRVAPRVSDSGRPGG